MGPGSNGTEIGASFSLERDRHGRLTSASARDCLRDSPTAPGTRRPPMAQAFRDAVQSQVDQRRQHTGLPLTPAVLDPEPRHAARDAGAAPCSSGFSRPGWCCRPRGSRPASGAGSSAGSRWRRCWSRSSRSATPCRRPLEPSLAPRRPRAPEPRHAAAVNAAELLEARPGVRFRRRTRPRPRRTEG